MSFCRDWSASSWPSSFKGFPFHTDRESEEGGRAIITHEFPGRDTPFLEDMGEASRTFDVTAYLASDTADVEALAFMAILASEGPGLLVTPIRGPVLVRAVKPFKRDTQKDKQGYIAFSLRFIREGASFGIATVDSTANLLLVAVGALVGVLAALDAVTTGSLVKPVTTVTPGGGGSEPAAVLSGVAVEAYTQSVENAAAIVEAVRKSATVEPVAAAAVRDSLATLMRAPLVADPAAQITGALSLMAASMEPMVAHSALAPLLDYDFGPGGLNISDFSDEPNTIVELSSILALGSQFPRTAAVEHVERAVRIGALGALAEVAVRTAYPDRRAGITARAMFADHVEKEMEQVSGSPALADVYVALADLQGRTAEWLTMLITTLAPVVTITAPLTMPSLWWSWRQYGSAERSTELVARNRVAHPSFMPIEFEALAT